MSFGIKLHLPGDFACFTRPEMKVERVSYDVIAILTDGHENASLEYSQNHIADLIGAKKELGWEFVFLAANQNAIASATALRIDAADAVNFVSDKDGTDLAFKCISEKVAKKRKKYE